MDHQENAMQPAPDDECPAGTVPQPPQKHRDEEVEIAAQRSFPVAAQGEIMPLGFRQLGVSSGRPDQQKSTGHEESP